ncbi:hypothetical protein WA158_004537 [Blastocystis sp. Blastoise]
MNSGYQDYIYESPNAISSNTQNTVNQNVSNNEEESTEGYCLFVKGFQQPITHEQLYQVFGCYGRLREVKIPTDYHSKQQKGFAYITYYDKSDTTDAYDDLQNQQICNQTVVIAYAKDNRKTADQMKLLEGKDNKSSQMKRNKD